ncbi:hypothetical protein L596_012137 [Steinernema carpocapsae]|uniref:BTB domain-containing protein n=3 Tax=Steinernema carpocapsae TaxID=34508 RepID=A0A4U5NWS7_STECR|nr:hypothetical protein L596_012137 [Steinernema carpocapsae]
MSFVYRTTNAQRTAPPKMTPKHSDVMQPLTTPQTNGIKKTSSEVLLINVGGRSARLPVDNCIYRLETGRLATFAARSHNERLIECDAYFEATKEYYFERSPIIFEYIVDFYTTGKLHRPMDICPIRLRYELEFWKIPLNYISPCCQMEELNRMNKMNHHHSSTNEQIYLETSCPPTLFEKVWLGKFRLVVWTLFENPRSSSMAKGLSIVSAAFVLLSLAGLILGSMPEFQEGNDMEPHWTINVLEACCMVWFTFEYVVRFFVSPRKCKFIKSPLNVIDLMTIVPFYAEAALPSLGIEDLELRNLRGAMVVIRVMRLARVARIFKLARYSTGLRAFGETMQKSAAELSMLGMFLLTGIMLFSTAIYFFERDEENSKFYSIPAACWWCVITMTTVGYGDLVPVTTGGKVVAAMASVCGIIVLAFPISMIIDKFAESTGFWAGGGEDLTEVDMMEQRMKSTRRTKSRRYLF